MTRIDLTGVAVTVGDRLLVAVDRMSVDSGEWVGLIGPNGAGKTTLLRAVQGTVEHRGTVRFDGRNRGAIPRVERSRLVASVPQRPLVPADMRVADYVLLGRTPYIPYLGTERVSDLLAAREAMFELDVLDLVDRRLGTLSGGELQRVILARALAQEAPVLLLDEPTSSLDVGHTQQVMGLIDELRRARGLTLLTALHDLTLAAQFCDRLLLLADGRVVADGPARAVLTEGTIARHYGATVRILDDGDGGIVVIPVREDSSRRAPSRSALTDGEMP